METNGTEKSQAGVKSITHTSDERADDLVACLQGASFSELLRKRGVLRASRGTARGSQIEKIDAAIRAIDRLTKATVEARAQSTALELVPLDA